MVTSTRFLNKNPATATRGLSFSGRELAFEDPSPLSWAFQSPGGTKYKLFFHNGSFKKKVLKYGTPKPSIHFAIVSAAWRLALVT